LRQGSIVSFPPAAEEPNAKSRLLLRFIKIAALRLKRKTQGIKQSMSTNPTRLDTEETSGQSLDPSDYRAIRIHPVRKEYSAAYELYSHLDGLDNRDRSNNLQGCRRYAWFVRDTETGTVHVASNSCKLRWCPVCSRARTFFIQRNVLEFATGRTDLRFMTLTLRHTSQGLSEQIDYLYACFRKLRKYKQFKHYVTGGIWFFQVTIEKSTGCWHPHLHCLITGRYMPKSWLVKAWSHITKGSYICDIKYVKNASRAAKYVARYCARPVNLSDHPMELRLQIFESFHGRRLNGTWGKAKDVSLSPSTQLAEGRFERLGSWSTIYHSRMSFSDAMAIYKAWKEKTTIDPGISMMDVEEFLNGKELDYEVDDFREKYRQYQFW